MCYLNVGLTLFFILTSVRIARVYWACIFRQGLRSGSRSLAPQTASITIVVQYAKHMPWLLTTNIFAWTCSKGHGHSVNRDILPKDRKANPLWLRCALIIGHDITFAHLPRWEAFWGSSWQHFNYLKRICHFQSVKFWVSTSTVAGEVGGTGSGFSFRSHARVLTLDSKIVQRLTANAFTIQKATRCNLLQYFV